MRKVLAPQECTARNFTHKNKPFNARRGCRCAPCGRFCDGALQKKGRRVTFGGLHMIFFFLRLLLQFFAFFWCSLRKTDSRQWNYFADFEPDLGLVQNSVLAGGL
ncbi:hypothetical protein H6B15_04090 [Gemmiger formicilis]|uniref:hypothetical protein n=1 Tax=Gemmiger formicilis TaxID=745368 RepID=UPI001957C28C|nr:hypothetical protein [Gemmiger formicilis]MBM6715841.1 hypothetical protein [Gemmiger formicilis]